MRILTIDNNIYIYYNSSVPKVLERVRIRYVMRVKGKKMYKDVITNEVMASAIRSVINDLDDCMESDSKALCMALEFNDNEVSNEIIFRSFIFDSLIELVKSGSLKIQIAKNENESKKVKMSLKEIYECPLKVGVSTLVKNEEK